MIVSDGILPERRRAKAMSDRTRLDANGERTLNAVFDPHALDWSRHRPFAGRGELGPGVFLADAVNIFGEALLEAWSNNETSIIDAPAPMDVYLPSPESAFEDGVPVFGIHRTFGPTVRRVMSPGAWQDIALRLQDHEAWLRSHVLDRDGVTPVSAPALRARNGEDLDDPITEDNWQAAYENIVLEHGFRNWALKAVSIVSHAVAELARRPQGEAGSVVTYARPIAGGPSVVLDPVLWNASYEIRMRRLATCGLNLTRPFDPLAEIDHLIFIEEDGLTATVELYAAMNRVPAIPPDHPWWEEVEEAADARNPRYPALEDRVREILEVELRKPENHWWRVPQAQKHIGDLPDFGRGYEQIVHRVCEDLKAEGGYASLGRSGRPSANPKPRRRRVSRPAPSASS